MIHDDWWTREARRLNASSSWENKKEAGKVAFSLLLMYAFSVLFILVWN